MYFCVYAKKGERKTGRRGKEKEEGEREREKMTLFLRIFGPTSVVLYAKWMLAVDMGRFKLASKRLVFFIKNRAADILQGVTSAFSGRRLHFQDS